MVKNILVVDDSKTVRNLMTFILKNVGYRVILAEDGLDGLEKLYSNDTIDLIVSDINMPQMDGYTFIQTVREQEKYKNIPIIIVSTEKEEQDIQKGMRSGADLYLVKPVPPEQLIQNIKMLLG